jgi:hypothetical protein
MPQDEKNPLSPHYRRPEPKPATEDSIAGTLFLLAVAGIGQLIGGIVVLLIMYGLVLLIFRHAFGVELPNPFNWFR